MSGVQSESGEFGVHILVDDQATLDAALASVSGGETIIMRAGEYDSIKLRNQEFTSTVNIVSEDDDNPAVLTGVIDIKSISGLLDFRCGSDRGSAPRRIWHPHPPL